MNINETVLTVYVSSQTKGLWGMAPSTTMFYNRLIDELKEANNQTDFLEPYQDELKWRS